MKTEQYIPEISVLMPTYNQSAFISRALESLINQSFRNWELIIVNDGCTDDTEKIVNEFLSDERIIYLRNFHNEGLGNSLNKALTIARGSFIAYLPSDDVYFESHLETLYTTLRTNPDSVLAYSGTRYNYNRYTRENVPDHPVQLVQVLHRATGVRWLEREELVTDDLNKMFWEELKTTGKFVGTNEISCEWVCHPDQRHKKIREPLGGINLYRSYYQVRHPLRFHSSVGNYMDEYKRFSAFKSPVKIHAKDKLKILLVGELAYNPERIMALEEQGHELYGLWMKEPYWFNYVGPLPFGHIKTLNRETWREEVEQIEPDIIYGLLNWQAVPFVNEILIENPDIPFVWHFKEGPFICMEKGIWKELVNLYTHSDGQIYTSPEMRQWFSDFLPEYSRENTFILDGDLPKMDWFRKKKLPLLSEVTEEIHTVVPGRPIGLHPHIVEELATEKIHLHFYGDFTQGQWKEWIEESRRLAPGYLHIHPNVDQDQWVEEFSKYDAGWLHAFDSLNFGEIRRATWDDLNMPARMATLALSGLPFIQKDNEGHIVATQTFARNMDIGIFFKDIPDLSRQLRNKKRMNELRDNVWNQRKVFTFDHHADSLVTFFRKIIAKKKEVTMPKDTVTSLANLF